MSSDTAGLWPQTMSPCVGYCSVNSVDLCPGCYRTLHEISQWSTFSSQQKAAVNTLAKARRHTHENPVEHTLQLLPSDNPAELLRRRRSLPSDNPAHSVEVQQMTHEEMLESLESMSAKSVSDMWDDIRAEYGDDVADELELEFACDMAYLDVKSALLAEARARGQLSGNRMRRRYTDEAD